MRGDFRANLAAHPTHFLWGLREASRGMCGRGDAIPQRMQKSRLLNQAPKVGRFRERGDFPLSLPRMLDRLRRVLSGYDPVGWLGLPMDFMNSTGVLRPIEECGRT